MATNKPPKRTQKVLQKCVPLLLRGHRKRAQERGLNFGHMKDFLAPTPSVRQPLFETSELIEFGKRVFWKRGLFRKIHFLELLESLETLEILENPQTVENKGEPIHFLEILENLEILPVKRPLS